MLNNAPSLLGQLLALVIAAALVMGSPGPSTISVTAIGAAFGWRRAAPFVGGAIMGTIIALLAVAAGVVAILLATPNLAPILIAASAIYILYLAFRIATAPPLSSDDGNVAAPSFAGGFALAIANPKAYLAIGAIFAQAQFAGLSPAAAGALKIAVLAVMIVLIHLAWLMIGAVFARALRDPATSRMVNRILALLLVVATLPALMT